MPHLPASDRTKASTPPPLPLRGGRGVAVGRGVRVGLGGVAVSVRATVGVSVGVLVGSGGVSLGTNVAVAGVAVGGMAVVGSRSGVSLGELGVDVDSTAPQPVTRNDASSTSTIALHQAYMASLSSSCHLVQLPAGAGRSDREGEDLQGCPQAKPWFDPTVL
jgi:hypothetical protein